jgi:hypothetical protein
MYGEILKLQYWYTTDAKIFRSGRPILLVKTKYPSNTRLLREWDQYPMGFLAARRVLTYLRRKAGIGFGGGQPGSITWELCSLDTSHVDVEPPMGARRDAKYAGGESQSEEIRFHRSGTA